ncbi:cytochrome P450 [Mycena crocata]|nr:cytochrome P450 [Mycena crocata]
MSNLPNFGALELTVFWASVSVCYILFRRLRGHSSTALKGPSSNNFIFGVMPYLMDVADTGAVFEDWAAKHGSVYSIPGILGSSRVVLNDPKALTHYFSKETYGYIQTPQARRFLERLIGRGLFYAEGDSHKRQRRALNPAFSNASIKNLTPIFYDSAYKAKAMWDGILESSSSEGAVIEVQQWLVSSMINHQRLDTIGLAGFSHDFDTLSGQPSVVATAFDSLGSKMSRLEKATFLLSLIFPVFDRIPSYRGSMMKRLGKTMRECADTFLSNTAGRDIKTDKSVIGLLGKSFSFNFILPITLLTLPAQINVLLLAGYETTASKFQWALIELSRNPTIQTTLRDELLRKDGDPTWDQLTSNLPFLDAFTCEILRLHPPVPESDRIAAEDDILPLSTPLETADGKVVDSIFLKKGTIVTIPIESINRSVAFWGADAKVFNPSRWLDSSADQHRAHEIQGFRHILTFSDGPRMCLGRVFALTEFKAVLSVLVRNYTFELTKGQETPIGRHRNFLPRPKIEGEAGYDVPLRVRNHVSE